MALDVVRELFVAFGYRKPIVVTLSSSKVQRCSRNSEAKVCIVSRSLVEGFKEKNNNGK
jgi:hypothetical protein